MFFFFEFGLALLGQNPGGPLGLERVYFRATFGVTPLFLGPPRANLAKTSKKWPLSGLVAYQILRGSILGQHFSLEGLFSKF